MFKSVYFVFLLNTSVATKQASSKLLYYQPGRHISQSDKKKVLWQELIRIIFDMKDVFE